MDRLGWTIAETARNLGISERQVSRWRAGQVPRHKFVVQMARAFNRDPGWFYTDHPEEKAA